MNEFVKHAIVRFVLPVLAPVIVGIGSAIIATLITTERLEGRLTHVEDQIQRHERVIEKEFSRHEQNTKILSEKTDDQEKRLTRQEAIVGETQKMLSEIRSDIKTLLRERK